MENNKRILIKFSLYILMFLLIIIIGISNVFALEYNTTYNDTQTYYDNNGNSVSSVGSTWNESLQSYVSNPITTTANSYGAGVVINSPIPILSGHTYSLSIPFTNISYDLALSTKNRIAIGNDIGGTAYNYANNNYYANTLYSKVVNGKTLQFAFSSNGPANYIFIPWTTTQTHTQSYFLNSFIIEDLGSSGGVSESTINNSLNNQTTIINNSILASQNAITTNSDNNRDLIINNQNENTDKLIENDKVCTTYDASNIYEKNKFINDNGEISNVSGTWGITDFINIQNSNIEVLRIVDYSTSTNTCFYNNQKEKVSCIRTNNISLGNFTIPNNSYYVRFTIDYTNSKPQFKVCKSGNNALNDSINGLDDTLKNDNTDEATSEASDFFSNFNTNTFGLTSIITAPLNLIQSLTSKTCTPLHLPLPYLDNNYLDLPCMTTIYSEHFGSFFTLYQTITYGIIAYWVCVRIFNHVKDFKNPEHDEIEVVDL